MTHTYAKLEVSKATYDEIAKELSDVGYHHAFIPANGHVFNIINMHGIGLCVSNDAEDEQTPADRIENALQAMSETHSSWESRCHAIMAALGLDCGNQQPPLEDLVKEWVAERKTFIAGETPKLHEIARRLARAVGEDIP